MNPPASTLIRLLGVVCLVWMEVGAARGFAAEPVLRAGVARVDITPEYPVRLSGFGFRRTESEGVTQRIWAKAIAFEDPATGPAVLVTTDNLGVTDAIRREVAQRLAGTIGLKPERFSITATHTHTAPMLSGALPTLFSVPIPPEHQAQIDRYTQDFIKAVERAALEAWAARKPVTLAHAVGSVAFAANRRTKGGPVDHDLPVMTLRDPSGALVAVYTSYACHCVTLSNNKISGDWAGYAQTAIEAAFPGVVALTSVGCGADSNPSSGVTGDRAEVAAAQGKQIADEVVRLLNGPMRPVIGPLRAAMTSLLLPMEPLPTRSQWEEKAKRADAVGYHARYNLAKLDRGEVLPTSIPYPEQTWTFGDSLAMVFLPGEVVVDYSLRLKREFDRARLWVNAYANDAPCYIPSERILREGGYEGGDAMVYYDRPARFAPGLEQRIIDVIRDQLPAGFRAPKGTDGTRPLSPKEALQRFQVGPGLEVELVASEPLIQSPVAIDWGADGRLWVCEMFDYPQGLDNNWKPGGRVKRLEDTDGDGRPDRADLFVTDLPFPTGLMAWGNGVLVCAAPDLLYAEDTDNDGRADRIVRLFSGFSTENYQARVNGLSLGLDGWIYGANGLLGGNITNHLSGGLTDIRGRDFRFKIDPGLKTARFEPVSGLTQQGRVRDDWDAWYGCDNTTLLRQFPMEDRHAKRNPHAAAPDPSHYVPAYPDSSRLYPVSRALDRFNDPDHLNRATSVCGIGIYRDRLLGEDYLGNAFMCEPVHNLVHRLVIESDGVVSRGHRAATETNREFLSSTDNWFRPVQVRTGPDGGLWVVDIYRFLMEHPRWITPGRLAELDMRAGAGSGRIYRVKPAGQRLAPVRDLTRLSETELLGQMRSANGTERDRAHLVLLHRSNGRGSPRATSLRDSALPEVRAQGLSLGLPHRTSKDLIMALRDPDPRVQALALRFAGDRLEKSPDANLLAALRPMAQSAHRGVRYQLMLALGASRSAAASSTLTELAPGSIGDPWLEAALIAAGPNHALPLLQALHPGGRPAPNAGRLIGALVQTVAATATPRDLAVALAIVLGTDTPLPVESLRHLAVFLERHPDLRPADAALAQRLEGVLAGLPARLNDTQRSPEERGVSLRLLGYRAQDRGADLGRLAQVALTDPVARVRKAAGLRLLQLEVSGGTLLGAPGTLSPEIRGELIQLLLSREESIDTLFHAIETGRIRAVELPLADRQRLQRPSSVTVRGRAGQLLPKPADRQDLLGRYAGKLPTTGQAAKGAEVFRKNCASCHALKGIGNAVGPDLLPLAGRDRAYWLQNILDPNAAIEPRYVAYEIETRNGETVSGVVRAETAASLTVAMASGQTETLLRSTIGQVRPMGMSLMPEGFDQVIEPGEMADLLAFLGASAEGRPAETLLPPRDPVSLARVILNPSSTAAEREGATSTHPHLAAAILQELVRELPPGTPEEYRRIPWIWRAAILTARRNDRAQLRSMLELSLPQAGERLLDWQAVVIGGGLINGLGQLDLWPAEQLRALIGTDEALGKRWSNALEAASAMARDTGVPTGTRYDAIRMLGMEGWTRRSGELLGFLRPGTHDELQMGAVSALADINHPRAAAALIEVYPRLSTHNQQLALDALLRDPARMRALLAAVKAGILPPTAPGNERFERMVRRPEADIRKLARLHLGTGSPATGR